MSDVISFVTSLLFIACLIYVPICAIVVLARSLASPGDGARVKFTAAPRIGIAYASKRDQLRKWRFTICR